MEAFPGDEIYNFTISGVMGGFADCNGLFRYEDEFLIFEILTKDSLFGVFKSSPKTIRLHVSHLISIRLKKGLFSTTLEIVTGSMKFTQDFPGSKDNRLSLSMKKKDYKSLSEKIKYIESDITEYKLKNIEKK